MLYALGSRPSTLSAAVSHASAWQLLTPAPPRGGLSRRHVASSHASLWQLLEPSLGGFSRPGRQQPLTQPRGSLSCFTNRDCIRTPRHVCNVQSNLSPGGVLGVPNTRITDQPRCSTLSAGTSTRRPLTPPRGGSSHRRLHVAASHAATWQLRMPPCGSPSRLRVAASRASGRQPLTPPRGSLSCFPTRARIRTTRHVCGPI